MELIERGGFFRFITASIFNHPVEGHTVFISGEAGIGKTLLIKAFCKNLKNHYPVYQGTCDALFSPRPQAPLYDILLQRSSPL